LIPFSILFYDSFYPKTKTSSKTPTPIPEKIKEKFKRTYIAEKHPCHHPISLSLFLEAVLNFFGK